LEPSCSMRTDMTGLKVAFAILSNKTNPDGLRLDYMTSVLHTRTLTHESYCILLLGCNFTCGTNDEICGSRCFITIKTQASLLPQVGDVLRLKNLIFMADVARVPWQFNFTPVILWQRGELARCSVGLWNSSFEGCPQTSEGKLKTSLHCWSEPMLIGKSRVQASSSGVPFYWEQI
jgi:hypothetical protein